MNGRESPSAQPKSNLSRSHVLMAVGAFALVVGMLTVPIPTRGRMAVALGDMVHPPLFAGITLAVLIAINWINPSDSSIVRWRRAIVAGIAIWTFGLGMEITQSMTGRTASVDDAIANGCGVLAAAMCYLTWYSSNIYLRAGLVCIAIASLVYGWHRPVMMFVDAIRIQREFPTLASFESQIELTRWYPTSCEIRRSNVGTTKGNFCAEVRYGDAQYPNISLSELVRDWTEVQSLHLDVMLDQSYPDDEVKFSVVILDEHFENYDTDVFLRQWRLKPGESRQLVIFREDILNGPQERQMDLAHIHAVNLLLESPAQPAKIRFDNIHLNLRAPTADRDPADDFD